MCDSQKRFWLSHISRNHSTEDSKVIEKILRGQCLPSGEIQIQYDKSFTFQLRIAWLQWDSRVTRRCESSIYPPRGGGGNLYVTIPWVIFIYISMCVRSLGDLYIHTLLAQYTIPYICWPRPRVHGDFSISLIQQNIIINGRLSPWRHTIYINIPLNGTPDISIFFLLFFFYKNFHKLVFNDPLRMIYFASVVSYF